MTFDLFLRFRIGGTRNEVNKIFRSIPFRIQLERKLLNDPFLADRAETRMQNSLCFIWKDLFASDLGKAEELVDFHLRKMLSHLPTARIKCGIDTSQRPTVLGDIIVEVENGKSQTGTSEGHLH
jgi:hypothetical protein